MRASLVLAVMLIGVVPARADTTAQNLAKYRGLRQRLASEFVSVGTGAGQSQPAPERTDYDVIVQLAPIGNPDAGVEVLRGPDNSLQLRWPADRAFVADSDQPSPAATAVWDRVAAALRQGGRQRGRRRAAKQRVEPLQVVPEQPVEAQHADAESRLFRRPHADRQARGARDTAVRDAFSVGGEVPGRAGREPFGRRRRRQ